MSNQIQTAGLSEAEAAIYLGISRSTLRHGRCDGKRENRMPPPPFIKVGRRVIYLRVDLDAWMQRSRVDLTGTLCIRGEVTK